MEIRDLPKIQSSLSIKHLKNIQLRVHYVLINEWSTDTKYKYAPIHQWAYRQKELLDGTVDGENHIIISPSSIYHTRILIWYMERNNMTVPVELYDDAITKYKEELVIVYHEDTGLNWAIKATINVFSHYAKGRDLLQENYDEVDVPDEINRFEDEILNKCVPITQNDFIRCWQVTRYAFAQWNWGKNPSNKSFLNKLVKLAINSGNPTFDQRLNRSELLHRKAMNYSDKGFMARKKGDTASANIFLEHALSFEADAASILPPQDTYEPSRSILYRSAASLAYDLKQYGRTQQLVYAGLEGHPTGEMVDDFNELSRIIQLTQGEK